MPYQTENWEVGGEGGRMGRSDAGVIPKMQKPAPICSIVGIGTKVPIPTQSDLLHRSWLPAIDHDIPSPLQAKNGANV
jgi:hypothetical protein